MAGLTWKVSSGTGVLGHFGPLHWEAFPELAYRRLLQIFDESKLQCMKLAGVRGLQSTYEWFEREMAKVEGPIGLAGHSQPPIHFVRLASNHPNKFPMVFSVAGAFYGSTLATKPLLSRFPCSRDLAPKSDYLRRVQQEFAAMQKSVPAKRQPRVICVAVYRDSIVRPWHSSLLPGAENYVLAREEPDKLPHDAVWIPTKRELHHFNVIRDHEAIEIMAQLIQNPLKTALSERPLPLAA